MSDAGPFTVLFGDNILSRNNLLPRWEKFQASFTTLYIVFIVLFGVISPMTLPYCLPIDDEAHSPKEMNDAESRFFAHYCRYQINGGMDPVTLRFMIVCFVFLAVIFSNTLLESSKSSSSIIIYTTSEKKITRLGLPLSELKKMVVTPILDQEDHTTPEMKIRNVIKKMINYEAGDVTIVLLWRGLYTVVTLAIGFYFTINLYVSVITRGNGPYIFDCMVNDDLPGIRNFSKFLCSESWSRFDFMIAALYQIVIVMHCGACLIGLFKITKIRHQVKGITGHGGSTFVKASRCMLHLAEMNKDRDKDSFFYEFVLFIFDHETLNIMERSILVACGHKGKKSDKEFLSICSHMVNKSAVYDRWLHVMVKQKRWTSIVLLLNELQGHFKDLHFVKEVVELLDDEENNILYYAMHKEPGFSEFNINAASCILKQTDMKDRVVIHKCDRFCAVDFVQLQYDDDPTYPEYLKNALLTLCNENSCSVSPVKVSA